VIDLVGGDETMGRLYPNPVEGQLNIEIWSVISSTARLKISDASGREVRSEEFGLHAGKNSTLIDLQSLADGLYFISVKTEGELYEAKIIKRR
jgi:hypothetical protein